MVDKGAGGGGGVFGPQFSGHSQEVIGAVILEPPVVVDGPRTEGPEHLLLVRYPNAPDYGTNGEARGKGLSAQVVAEKLAYDVHPSLWGVKGSQYLTTGSRYPEGPGGPQFRIRGCTWAEAVGRRILCVENHCFVPSPTLPAGLGPTKDLVEGTPIGPVLFLQGGGLIYAAADPAQSADCDVGGVVAPICTYSDSLMGAEAFPVRGAERGVSSG